MVVTRPTIVIVDDHPIWRDGLRAELMNDFNVVGEASDAPGAIETITRLKPDLVLCDLHMPGGGGVGVVASCGSMTTIVVLTVSEQERDLLDAVAAGAQGYLLKSTPGPDLVDALRRVVAGEPAFSPALASLLLGEFRRLRNAASDPAALSPREREVLQLVARGHPYREIASELFISEKTVENHVRNTLKKLRLTKRHELTRFALDHGLD